MKERRRFSISDRLKSFPHAFRGLFLVVREEHNMRIHLALSLVAIVLGIWLKLTPAEWVMIVFAIGFVLVSELFNTSIEHLANFVNQHHEPRIGRVKDIAAAAVLIAAVTAIGVGCFIFVPRLLSFL